MAGAEGALCYDRSTMERLLDALTSVEIEPIAIVDIVLTALLFYWLFSLIRGTRAVRLVIGVISLYVVYAAAQFFGLQLLSQLMQTGAVVGLLALVVVFQPELRRALERIGRFGSLSLAVVGFAGRAAPGGGDRRPGRRPALGRPRRRAHRARA